jgi:hypothetical protein
MEEGGELGLGLGFVWEGVCVWVSERGAPGALNRRGQAMPLRGHHGLAAVASERGQKHEDKKSGWDCARGSKREARGLGREGRRGGWRSAQGEVIN